MANPIVGGRSLFELPIVNWDMRFYLIIWVISLSQLFPQELWVPDIFEDGIVKRRVVGADKLVSVMARVNTDSRVTLESLGFDIQAIICLLLPIW